MARTYLFAILLGCQAPIDVPPFPAAEPANVGIDLEALGRLKARAVKANRMPW
jgi:hypothetical protein